MRINKYLALATGMSRRRADELLNESRVTVNGADVTAGYNVEPSDQVRLNGELLTVTETATIMLNKPVGYVCSRDGQGNLTVYHLIPEELHRLKPVGRLDKDSSGLLLMTDDGNLAHKLTHPSFEKQKVYDVMLNKPLLHIDKKKILDGILLDDGLSSLQLRGNGTIWEIRMHEGRNRQIRRTFEELSYQVISLRRSQFGPYKLNTLAVGKYISL